MSLINDYKLYNPDLPSLLYEHAYCYIIAPMTYEEFRRQIGKAGLTNRAFADLVKMSRVSVSNYSKRGSVPSHLAVIAALLGELGERHVDFREVLRKIEIEPKAARGGGTVGKFGGGKRAPADVEETKESH